MLKAGVYAFRDRRAKKRTFRALWTVKINAALHEMGLGYSKFIHALKLKNIGIDRKVLAVLAEKHPTIFSKVVAATK